MQIAADVTQRFGVAVVPMAGRPDKDAWHGDEVYELAYLFCTRDGSWEPDPNWPGSIEQRFRDRFLKAPDDPEYCAGGGGDHHMFQAVIGQDGKLMRGKGLRWWQGNIGDLGTPGFLDTCDKRNTDERGWGDLPTWEHYSPSAGQVGKWCMCPFGLSDVVVGLGMPDNWHMSFFGVWRAKPAVAVPEDPGGGNEPPGGNGEAMLRILAEIVGIRADLRRIFMLPPLEG